MAENFNTNEIKTNVPKLDENKLKQLEARFLGPSSDGNLPVEIRPFMETDFEQIKTKFSNKSENNTINEIQKEILNNPSKAINENSLNKGSQNLSNIDQNHFLQINENNGQNSNKSVNSTKKKNLPKRVGKKTKITGNLQIDFLTIKRNRTEAIEGGLNNQSTGIKQFISTDSPLSYERYNEQQLNEDNIEFSSKNVITHTTLFKNSSNNLTKVSGTKPKSETKINEYFQKTAAQTSTSSKNPNYSLNNVSVLQTPDSNYKAIKKLQEENDKINKEIIDIKALFLEKDKQVDKLKCSLSENEELTKNMTILNKQLENQIHLSKLSVIKYLKENEEIKRNNKKKWLNEQEYKLGRANVHRVGQSIIDGWENGEEIIKLNQRLKDVEQEKEKLEKQKKNLTSFIKKRNHTITSNNVENGDPTENEINDLRELINFKISIYQKEEVEIKENLCKLEIEKVMLMIERKRFREEELSRFRGIQSKEKFPILSGRYLILNLLGKGGYSEVYRAFDLENNIEVACKIHQLNSQWSDSIKENYIRHTIRENQIHKEIVHSKIVRHYDTIEIDQNSFCTVLELCSGPDLHTYLKMHKQLSEKEARGIICQILSGLEYLSNLQKKIIHYDLKPQNIIFHNMEVKISDFGLAKIIENNSDNIELTSQGVGTYWYLPPECFETSRNPPGISSKVDIWSLGVILYELIYGIRPFGHNLTQDKILTEGIILNAKQIEFPNRPVISKACQDFIEKCLAKKKEDRFDVFEALEHEFIKLKKK